MKIFQQSQPLYFEKTKKELTRTMYKIYKVKIQDWGENQSRTKEKLNKLKITNRRDEEQEFQKVHILELVIKKNRPKCKRYK